MEGLAEDAGVMARRTSCAESIPTFSGHHLVYSLYGGASGYQRRLPRFFRSDCVLIVKVTNDFIPSPLQLCYSFHHFLNVIKVVNFENVGDFCPLFDVLFENNWWWWRAAS